MSTKKNNKVRLVDIARETGFSIKTVSRVVNNQGDVSPKTRQAIMKVVNKYNYSPNPMAATLRPGGPGRSALSFRISPTSFSVKWALRSRPRCAPNPTA